MGNRSSRPSSTFQALQNLTSRDLAILLNILNLIASKWYALGLQLGLQYQQLRTVEHDYRKCEEQLREIIVGQEPPITWCDLTTALRSECVGENRLASEIEKRYVHNLPAQTATSNTSEDHTLSCAYRPTSPVPTPVSGYRSSNKLPTQPAVSVVPSLRLSTFSQSSHVNQPQPVTENYAVDHQSSLAHSPLMAFVEHVKTTYRSKNVERGTFVVKWPPTPSEVYINLVCIDRRVVGLRSEYDEITKAMVRHGNVDVILNATKGPIDFSEIAKDISISSKKVPLTPAAAEDEINLLDERRLILVEGAPGVGKSTFAWEFCRRWERGEIAQQYQLVLLLRLRDDRISKARCLQDLIYHPLEGIAEAACTEVVLSHDFHALIILEGFDELPDSCRNPKSIFMELIAGKLLPLATFLVTSRPWATQVIRQNYENCIHQHIEILGFTNLQITKYLGTTLSENKLHELNTYLDRHPQIRMGMYIPLNSAIVVTVFKESQTTGCALPTTLTELYTALARSLLLRYLCGHPVYETSAKFLQTFKDLPPAVYAKFLELCKLA